MNTRVSKILIFLILVFSFASCAKRGRPTGGKKDSIPPILVSADPNHKSTHFKAKKIKISFDEYIKLKNVNKQLVVSPPLKNAPEITPVGTASKFISIKLLDTLKENTTYTFNFGNSVVDNNEENKLERFKYVFSTGSYIDSLEISGTIHDGFNQKSDDNISVMLYEINEQFSDSTIYKQKPMYVTSTLDSTNFELTNLKAGNYLLVAIKQPVNSYIYKPKQDKIGFVNTVITLPTDSVFSFPIFNEIPPFNLFRPVETSKGHILFGFEGNADSLNVKLLDEKTPDFNEQLVFEKGKDTLNYWFQGIEKDSLIFEVSNKDFLEQVSVKLRSPNQDSLKINNNISSILEYRDTFSISSTIPITKIDTSKIALIHNDSIKTKFSAEIDSYKKRLFVNFEKNYKTKYNIQFLPEALFDVFGNTNDTLNYKFLTKALENYGIINLTVSNVNSPIIIQLITDKNEVISSTIINESQTLKFKNLPPKKYIVRAIFDTNYNGFWDTGSYLQKIQPEKVQYYSTPLELRANWELNETFILN